MLQFSNSIIYLEGKGHSIIFNIYWVLLNICFGYHFAWFDNYTNTFWPNLKIYRKWFSFIWFSNFIIHIYESSHTVPTIQSIKLSSLDKNYIYSTFSFISVLNFKWGINFTVFWFHNDYLIASQPFRWHWILAVWESISTLWATCLENFLDIWIIPSFFILKFRK